MLRDKGARKALLGSLLLLAALCLILAACAGGNNAGNERNNAGTTEPSGASNGNDTNGGTAKEVAEEVADEGPIELTWMVRGVVLPDSFGQRYVEERYNVRLNMVSVADADYVQRQQIMMTTGDVPDVMLVMDPNEMKKYADQGLLAEVPLEMIAEHAPRTKAQFDEHAPQGWFYSEHNGVNYGLPTLYPSGQFTTPVAWRTDLLQQAGITTIPQTIDEMTEAFAALKEIGVYGMSTNGNSWYYPFQKIFGAYGVMPMQWMVRDGEIVNGAVLPETKEALTLLADWYAKGYIDPEFVTGADLGPKFIDGVYAFNESSHNTSTDINNPNSALSTLKSANPDGMIEFGPLPSGPQGKSGGWAWGGAGNVMSFGRQITDQPEKLAIALQIMDDAINEQDVFFTLAFGELGKHWEYVNGSDFTEGVRNIAPYDDRNLLREEGIGGLQSFFGGSGNFGMHELATGESIMAINNLYLDGSMYDVFGKPDILPSAGQYWGDLQNLKTVAFAEIIRGDRPVDYFDSFVQQWNEMGGEKLREEGQALYDSMQ